MEWMHGNMKHAGACKNIAPKKRGTVRKLFRSCEGGAAHFSGSKNLAWLLPTHPHMHHQSGKTNETVLLQTYAENSWTKPGLGAHGKQAAPGPPCRKSAVLVAFGLPYSLK